MGVREGLLRPEFRDWYPRLVAGVWYRASWLVDDVLDQQRSGGPSWALDERVLSDAHFVFRAGRGGNPPDARMRRTDRGWPAPPSKRTARRRHIREEVALLVRSALGPPSGARPRRFYLSPPVADALLALAGAAGVEPAAPAGPWYVVEGRRPARRRSSSTRALPLVYREGAALVVDTWQGAKALAGLLNWCDVPPPRPA